MLRIIPDTHTHTAPTADAPVEEPREVGGRVTFVQVVHPGLETAGPGRGGHSGPHLQGGGGREHVAQPLLPLPLPLPPLRRPGTTAPFAVRIRSGVSPHAPVLRLLADEESGQRKKERVMTRLMKKAATADTVSDSMGIASTTGALTML